jgi:hypothetical protein
MVDKLQMTLMGPEPQIAAIATESQLVRALTWYSTMKDRSDAKKWLSEYCTKHRPDKAIVINKLPDDAIITTYGWLSRIVLRGTIVQPKVASKLSTYIDQLTYTPSERSGSSQYVSVGDKFGGYIADLDEAIDKCEKQFSCYNYLTTNSVSHSNAKRIVDYYQRLVDELVIAVNKSDEQVNQAYSHLYATEIKRLLAFAQSICDDCNKLINNNKKERKPRKPKTKTAASITKKLVYLANYDEMKLRSCSPEQIIGASILVTYNISNNMVTVFYGKDGGLSVHRSSISNYDEARLHSKKLGKKAESLIGQITSGTKRAVDVTFKSINSTAVAGSDRISNKVVLLKAYK